MRGQLDDIGATTEPAALVELRGNAVPILHEIRHALKQLVEGGVETIIDLRSVPMGPGDEARLVEELGVGEIHAELSALGHSTIRETAYRGVWLVEHNNDDGEAVSKFVEVTWVPAILRSQAEDVKDSLQNLTERLAAISVSAQE